MTDLSEVKARSALPKTTKLYFQKIKTGLHVGFRPSSGGWIARATHPKTHKRVFEALGDFGHVAETHRYDLAYQATLEWFEQILLNESKPSKVFSICSAFDAYIAHLRETGGNWKDAQVRFRRHIEPFEALSTKPLDELTRDDIRAWRRTLSVAQDGSARNPGTVNRDLIPLRAALNLALDEGMVKSDFAWAVPLRPATRLEGGGRDLYLDESQRKALLNSAHADTRTFIEGLMLLPIRVGALASLKVGDLDTKHKTLRISVDKAHAGRSLPLPDKLFNQLNSLVGGRPADSPLFTRNGKAWDKKAWCVAIKDTAKSAGLPDSVTAYTLRHCAITDLLMSGVPLQLVAELSGTSARMIAQNYSKVLKTSASREALSALRFT